MTEPNPLLDARGDLAKLLADGGLTAYTVAPEHPVDDGDEDPYPFAYVVASEPFLTFTGAPFGCAVAHVDVVVLSSAGANTTTAAELDGLILKALRIVEDSRDYDVDVDNAVSQPGRVTLDNEVHLAASIQTVRVIQL